MNPSIAARRPGRHHVAGQRIVRAEASGLIRGASAPDPPKRNSLNVMTVGYLGLTRRSPAIRKLRFIGLSGRSTEATKQELVVLLSPIPNQHRPSSQDGAPVFLQPANDS